MQLSTIINKPMQLAKFEKKGIKEIEDLLMYLPRKYFDFTRDTGILPPDQVSTFIVRILKITTYKKTSTCTNIFCVKEDSGEKVSITYFNQSWIANTYSGYVGSLAYVAGKVEYDEAYDTYKISSPLILEPNIEKGHKIVPVYSKVPRMSESFLLDSIHTALQTESAMQDIVPTEITDKYSLLPIKTAYTMIHEPKNMEEIDRARERFIMNDLMEYAVRAEWAKRNTAAGSPFGIKTIRAYQDIKDELPYQLTEDQQAAIEQMVQIARRGQRINALIQGDVGCGKTIVSEIMAALAFDSGYQTALMAPTQVLARQHYEDALKLLGPHGMRIAFLAGNGMKASEKRKILNGIESGYYDLIIGTQSIISKNVHYNNLALVITDEEHRFGVAQRKALTEKAMCGVHSITMSATPIPRSLATGLYGDSVQLITIKSMPNGRKPVKTGISTCRENIYRRIIHEAKAGHQTYVVCPMIDDNEDVDISSVEATFSSYSEALAPYGLKVATLTGRNTKEETEEILASFASGQLDVLISTTVIEVGVNCPNATCIVITNAERFGLASLHQLRGRVGRNKLQSYCVLESTLETEDAKKRLQAMCDTTSGFEIAKKDLELRGAGDFLGVKQSGENKILALMLAYPEKYEICKEIAKELIDTKADCPLMNRIIEDDEQAKQSADEGSSRWISHPNKEIISA